MVILSKVESSLQIIVIKLIMNTKQESTKYTEIQLKDALYKFTLYLQKINEDGDPHTRREKLCHLAAQASLKFIESEKLAQDVYEKLKGQIQVQKSYYLLYLLDILMKNHKLFYKMVRKDLRELEIWFKECWQNVHKEQKNSAKIQCLKAMARTWGVLYGQSGAKIEQNLKKWLDQKFNGTTLKLSERNEELFRECYDKQRSQKDSKDPRQNCDQKLLEALYD